MAKFSADTFSRIGSKTEDQGQFVEEVFSTNHFVIQADRGTVDCPMPMTPQLATFVAAIVSGLPKKEAAKRAGCSEAKADDYLSDPYVQQSIQHYGNKYLKAIKFDKVDAHHMYMTAYRNAATATEQMNATDRLVKLHKVDRDDSDTGAAINSKSVANLPREKLLQLAQIGLDTLTPTTIEGELTDG